MAACLLFGGAGLSLFAFSCGDVVKNKIFYVGVEINNNPVTFLASPPPVS